MGKMLRLTATGVIAATAAIGLAPPASAHVHVTANDATQGGYGVLTFRVPTESDTASTTDVLVTFPDDEPIVSVATQPKPGWTATVTRKKLATPLTDDDGNPITDYVSGVEWKADNPQSGIPPHEFDEFNVSAGPLPKEETIYFPANQTYSDGTVVEWNETTAVGQPEPDHPAPMLMLAAGVDQPAAGPATTGNAAATAATNTAPAWPGITALVVAVIAVLLGVANLALLRRRSS